MLRTAVVKVRPGVVRRVRAKQTLWTEIQGPPRPEESGDSSPEDMARDVALEGLLSLIENAVLTSEMKTSSHSRAGRRIQTRITYQWGQKPDLGYVAYTVEEAEKLPEDADITHHPMVFDLAVQIFRLEKRIPSGVMLSELKDELARGEAWTVLVDLANHVRRQLTAVLTANQNANVNITHPKKHLRRDGEALLLSLRSVVERCLTTGVQPDDIREAVQNTLVQKGL